MMRFIKSIFLCGSMFFFVSNTYSQQPVKFVQKENEKKVDVMVNGQFFTSYIYDSMIDKPDFNIKTSPNGTKLYMYAVNYNVLKIQDGMGGLLFTK